MRSKERARAGSVAVIFAVRSKQWRVFTRVGVCLVYWTCQSYADAADDSCRGCNHKIPCAFEC